MVININTVMLAVLIIELSGIRNQKKLKTLPLRIQKRSCYMIQNTENNLRSEEDLLVADALTVLSVVEKCPNLV